MSVLAFTFFMVLKTNPVVSSRKSTVFAEVSIIDLPLSQGSSDKLVKCSVNEGITMHLS